MWSFKDTLSTSCVDWKQNIRDYIWIRVLLLAFTSLHEEMRSGTRACVLAANQLTRSKDSQSNYPIVLLSICTSQESAYLQPSTCSRTFFSDNHTVLTVELWPHLSACLITRLKETCSCLRQSLPALMGKKTHSYVRPCAASRVWGTSV